MRLLNWIAAVLTVVVLLSSCGTEQADSTEPSTEATEVVSEEVEKKDNCDSENEEISEVHTEYDKILEGDFVAVAGIYEYPSGNRFELLSNGLSDTDKEQETRYPGIKFNVEDIKKEKDGSYIWSVLCYDNGECMDSAACIIWPIGIEVVAYDGRILDTDTSRIRFWSGQDAVAYEEYIAYKID